MANKRPLSVVILTEDEPFTLAGGYCHFLEALPPWLTIAGVVLFDSKPARQMHDSVAGSIKALATYGLFTSLRAVTLFLSRRWRSAYRVDRVFAYHSIQVLRGAGDINSDEFLNRLSALEPDIIVSVGVHQIFRKDLMQLAPMGCINVHLSLLPYHRGPAPVFWALHDGDMETGVSVHAIAKGIDTGPVIAQQRLPIGERCFINLLERQRLLAMDTLLDALNRLQQGNWTPIRISKQETSYQGWPNASSIRKFRAGGNRFF